MKSTMRAIPQKRCSPPISNRLGVFEAIHSSLEMRAFWGTPFFDYLLIFTIWSENNYFKIKWSCMQLSNKLLFARYASQFGKVKHFNLCKRCSFSVSSWLRRRNSPAGLGKRSTFLQKQNVHSHYFVVLHNLNVVLIWFFFVKNIVVGCPLLINPFHLHVSTKWKVWGVWPMDRGWAKNLICKHFFFQNPIMQYFYIKLRHSQSKY